MAKDFGGAMGTALFIIAMTCLLASIVASMSASVVSAQYISPIKPVVPTPIENWAPIYLLCFAIVALTCAIIAEQVYVYTFVLRITIFYDIPHHLKPDAAFFYLFASFWFFSSTGQTSLVLGLIGVQHGRPFDVMLVGQVLSIAPLFLITIFLHVKATNLRWPLSYVVKLVNYSRIVEETEVENFEDCSICLDPPADGDSITQLVCQHNFHRKCIEPWVLQDTTSPSCPLCRHQI